MAYFKYSGRDSAGAAVSGQLDAASIDEVAEQLFGNSITPIENPMKIRESRKLIARIQTEIKVKEINNA